MKLCVRCNKYKQNDDFYLREDRPCLYSFCTLCMDLEARSKDYPKLELRGSGSTKHR